MNYAECLSSNRTIACSSPQVESEHTSISLHPRQYRFPQFPHIFAHSLLLRHS
jgi:hypothetical protein